MKSDDSNENCFDISYSSNDESDSYDYTTTVHHIAIQLDSLKIPAFEENDTSDEISEELEIFIRPNEFLSPHRRQDFTYNEFNKEVILKSFNLRY